MGNTSMGYHTFAFFQKTDYEEYWSLEADFDRYVNETGKLKKSPATNKDNEQIGWRFSYKDNKDKGLYWIMLSGDAKNYYVTRGVLSVINPKSLLEDEYIVAAEESDLEEVEEIYNREVEKISKVLLKLGACSINRADPCLNIDIKELGIPCTPEQMMHLIKQGNIPRHYKERRKYNEKQRRMVDDKNSFYLESKSSVINYYWKYVKQKKEHPNYSKRELSKNVIRLEVECKYLKLYALTKDVRRESKYYESGEVLSMDEMYMRMYEGNYNPAIPIDIVLSERFYANIIRRDFNRVLRKGDYFTLDIARGIVESYYFRSSKEERMIEVLEAVNESRGIAKAKAKCRENEISKFNQALRELDDIFVNPVTIPRRWDIDHIPNLLSAYDDAQCDEQLVPYKEYYAKKHIEDFLEKIRQE